jgi:FkbM family methyltransferase
MNERLILFGAGAAGRYCLRYLREHGIEPYTFVDNDPAKQGTYIDGIAVVSPASALAVAPPNTEWIACAISRPAATEIRAELRTLGVPTKPLWECLPVCHGLPPDNAVPLLADTRSVEFYADQIAFRQFPDYDRQCDPEPCSEIYFPNFIQHRDDEHYVDCGAANGDTVQEFCKRWPKYRNITAIEADPANFHSLEAQTEAVANITLLRAAVSDHRGEITFQSNADWSSHIAERGRGERGNTSVFCNTLDNMVNDPSYIKFDIEGHELAALWGARQIIAEHSPVLAICAYHTSDHLWQIPALVRFLNPSYKLFFRRYAEGAFELVWYCVPEARWSRTRK